ncbi:MAG: hypothetical protein AB7H93_23485 [Vicinamibacterales bacterium]
MDTSQLERLNDLRLIVALAHAGLFTAVGCYALWEVLRTTIRRGRP